MNRLAKASPSIKFCAGASCPRPSHHRFCDGCYYDRAARVFAIYKSRLASIEADIAEVEAMGQEATSLHSAVLRRLVVCEQEAMDAGDGEGAWMWRKRMEAEIEGYTGVKKEADGYLRDLKADKERLKEGLGRELGELSRRQV